MENKLVISIDLPQDLIYPSLPQQETPENQTLRRAFLAKKKEVYLLSNANPLNLPLLKTPLPSEDSFSNEYNLGREAATAPTISNSSKVKSHLTDPFGPFLGLADYEKMYIDIRQPEVVSNWYSDEGFGEQRLSGVNPVIIKRVDDKQSLPSTLDISKLEEVLDNSAELDKLITAKHLYVADLASDLNQIPEGSVAGIQKYLPKPIGLFYWDEDGAQLKNPEQKEGRLLPLAIQIDVADGQVKVFTPNNTKLLWTIAKMCFSIADANMHEMSTHLGRSHFAQESFGAITPCHLAPQHPISILLRPHLRFLVHNNQQGMERLVQQGGPVDQLLGGTLQGSLKISVAAAKNWSVIETFPDLIKARGVDSKAVLPHYPYRDDGVLLWEAIANYVEEYLNIYYKSEQNILDDYELQNWAATLSDMSPEGGNIRDMPSKFNNIEQLSKIISVIIFTNSAGHSSVNYSQYPYLGFSPNLPLAGYSNYREFLAKEDSNEEEQLTFMRKFLPPQALALGQIDITSALSEYHFDSLGDYTKELTDPLAKHALYNFTQSLNLIEQRINIRNRKRVIPYIYMLPSEVLNSASI